MPLDGDHLYLASLAALDIRAFSDSLKNISDVPIRGLERFINDVRNGRHLGDSLDKFYKNILESVPSIKTDDSPDVGEHIAASLARSIMKMREYFSKISTDNPFGYHSSHLIPPDVNEMARFTTDVTHSFLRLSELMKLDNKALSLPALKDQYNLAFERSYKPVRNLLYKLLDDGQISKPTLNERVEDILCLEWYSGKLKDAKSDIRIIRNLFAHPDRIDRYDHYQLNVNGGVLKLYADDLVSLNTILVNKLMLITFLSNSMLDLEMYRRVFEE
jgi:hypothetical protein